MGTSMANLDWVAEVDQKLEHMSDQPASIEAAQWKKLSIYKMPASIIDGNEQAYKPQMVSFGPYHHEDPSLTPMEEHKQRALLHFLKRSKKRLQLFVESIAEVVETLMDSYDKLDSTWRNDRSKFLQLMIVDGVFMLEVLRGLNNGYALNDPIFSDHGKLHFLSLIKRDMLILENQLPLLLLVKLVAVESNKAEDEQSVYSLIVEFFSLYASNTGNCNGKCLHILDLYRKTLLSEDLGQNKPQAAQPPSCSIVLDKSHVDQFITIPSATKLHGLGIRFRKNGTQSLQNISFDSNGILRLPCIGMGYGTEPLLLNLMAFERLHVEAGNEVTCFLAFMRSIIKEDIDVDLLISAGIIANANTGNNQTVSQFFISLPKDITFQ